MTALSDRRFAGSSALVVGASSGIGKAIANRLAAEGAQVAIAARRVDRLDAMAKASGGRMHTVACDVNQEADVRRAVEETVQACGRIDILFNVAGAARVGTIVDGSTEDWDAVIRLTLRSAYLGIKYAARQMITTGTGGSIVNVSSLNQIVPFYGAASYATAKAGVGMLTQNAALELARHNIRVNALLPGLTTTEATGIIGEDPEINGLYMDRIPMGRAASSDEMAGAAVFLASEDASYITGASLVADGGWATTGYPDSSRWISRWMPKVPR